VIFFICASRSSDTEYQNVPGDTPVIQYSSEIKAVLPSLQPLPSPVEPGNAVTHQDLPLCCQQSMGMDGPTSEQAERLGLSLSLVSDNIFIT